jgi:ATP-dependent Clp protease protease subunit
MAALALSFHGNIGHPAITKLRNAICTAVNERVPDQTGRPTTTPKYDTLFLLMNSGGGALDDGLSLHNMLKSIPLKVTTVNMGFIASIAILPFLAGETRLAVPNSSFHFHSFEWNYPGAHTLTRQQFADHTQILDAQRAHTTDILKSATHLTDADLEQLHLLAQPSIRDVAFAKARGIVHDVRPFALPAGTPLFNVDY